MKCTPEREGIQVIIYGKGHGYSIKRSHLIQSTRECHHHHNFYIYRRHSFLYYHFIVYMYAVCMRALHSTAAKAASAEDHFLLCFNTDAVCICLAGLFPFLNLSHNIMCWMNRFDFDAEFYEYGLNPDHSIDTKHHLHCMHIMQTPLHQIYWVNFVATFPIPHYWILLVYKWLWVFAFVDIEIPFRWSLSNGFCCLVLLSHRDHSA